MAAMSAADGRVHDVAPSRAAEAFPGEQRGGAAGPQRVRRALLLRGDEGIDGAVGRNRARAATPSSRTPLPMAQKLQAASRKAASSAARGGSRRLSGALKPSRSAPKKRPAAISNAGHGQPRRQQRHRADGFDGGKPERAVDLVLPAARQQGAGEHDDGGEHSRQQQGAAAQALAQSPAGRARPTAPRGRRRAHSPRRRQARRWRPGSALRAG